jgi:hypothetical protein
MDYLLSAARQAAGTLTEAGIIFFLRSEVIQNTIFARRKYRENSQG